MAVLPGWYRQAYDKHLAKQNALRRAAQAKYKLALDAREGTDVGWQDLGMEFTCVPHEAYPWKPDLVKDLWKVDPSFRPMWVRWVFRKGDETRVYGFHVLARRVADPHGELAPFPVTMPTMPCQGLSFDQPNYVENYWMEDDGVGDLPGSYKSFESLYSFCKAAHKERTAAELKEQFITKPKEEADRRLAAARAEHEYKMRDIEKFTNKMLERVSELEMKERLLGEAEPKRKPTVVLGA